MAGDWLYVMTTRQGALKAFVTSVPARSPEAASLLISAMTQTAAICAPSPGP